MNNNKIYIILSVFSLLSLFLAIFFIFPLLGEIKKNSANLISEKNNMVTLATQNNETKNFKQNYEKYKPDLKNIDQLFIDINNPVDFIKFLEISAETSQITSQISFPVAPQNPQQPDQNFIDIQLSSKGSFSGVSDFVRKIEAGPFLIEIENLTIQNASDNTVSKDYSLKKVSAAFTIKAFTMPQSNK